MFLLVDRCSINSHVIIFHIFSYILANCRTFPPSRIGYLTLMFKIKFSQIFANSRKFSQILVINSLNNILAHYRTISRSPPCLRGDSDGGISLQKVQQGGISCCWVCTPCAENEFLVDPSICKSCPRGWWPSQDLTG